MSPDPTPAPVGNPAAANADAIINGALAQIGAGNLSSLLAGGGVDRDMVAWYVLDSEQDRESARFYDSTTPGEHFGYGTDRIAAEDAALNIRTWDDARQRQLADRLVDAGILDEDYSRAELYGAWGDLVGQAALQMKADPKTTLTPWDMIDVLGSGSGSGSGKGATAKDIVDRSVTLSDNNEARRLLNRMLSAELGRRATQNEIDSFQAALNDAQTRAPIVTTQTYNQAANTRQTTRSGGVDVEGFTESYVHDGDFDAEYGKYQAATTYSNALFDAIRSPV